MSFTTERAAAKLIMWVKLQIFYKSSSVKTKTPTNSPNFCLIFPFKPPITCSLNSHSFLDLTSHPPTLTNCKPLLRSEQTSKSFFFVPLPPGSYVIKPIFIKTACDVLPPFIHPKMILQLLKIKALLHFNTRLNSLVPQVVPLNPVMQVQLYESLPSVHAPLFWHGLGAQSSMSKASNENNVNRSQKIYQTLLKLF